MSSSFRRRRRGSPSENEPTKRDNLLKQFAFPTASAGRWSWVGTEVTKAEEITREHQLTAYGLTPKSGYEACPNKYLPVQNATKLAKGDGEMDENVEVIVVSDEEITSVCSKKNCKSNPRCLNYLGQDVWENQGEAAQVLCLVIQCSYCNLSQSQEQIQEVVTIG